MYGYRHPKVIIQVAAHVSGAAYYYQRKHITNDPWDKTSVSQCCLCLEYVNYIICRRVRSHPLQKKRSSGYDTKLHLIVRLLL